MKNENKKLIELCLKGLKKNTLNKENYQVFTRDYDKYKKNELTFRELIDAVKEPKGELRDAMKAYYANSQFNRVFKGR